MFYAFLATVAWAVAHGKVTLVNPELATEVLTPKKGSADGCDIAFDIVHLQDVSEGLQAPFEQFKLRVPSFLERLEKRYPGSRYSFASFVDKPLPHTGWYSDVARHDYCLKVSTGWTDLRDDLSDALDDITVGGGKDWLEGQLDALARIAMTDKVAWEKPGSTRGTADVVNVAVLFTDALPHGAGEAALFTNQYNEANPDDPWPVMPKEFDPNMVLHDENDGCAEYDYPHLEDVASLLREKGITPVVVAYPAPYPQSHCQGASDPCAWRPLRTLAHKYDDKAYLDPEEGMNKGWQSIFQEAKTGGLVFISDKTADYSITMTDILTKLASVKCSSKKSKLTGNGGQVGKGLRKSRSVPLDDDAAHRLFKQTPQTVDLGKVSTSPPQNEHRQHRKGHGAEEIISNLNGDASNVLLDGANNVIKQISDLKMTDLDFPFHHHGHDHHHHHHHHPEHDGCDCDGDGGCGCGRHRRINIAIEIESGGHSEIDL